MSKTTEKRVTRKPLHQRGPHTISGEKDPNFQYRFVNDSGSRITFYFPIRCQPGDR